MDKIEKFSRIAEAGRRAGSMDPVLRFATQEEFDEWKERARKDLAAVLAPVDGEPYDENLQGDKIAVRFSDIHTFEIFRINNRRHIIGDFETVEEYEAHVDKEFEALFSSFDVPD